MCFKRWEHCSVQFVGGYLSVFVNGKKVGSDLIRSNFRGYLTAKQQLINDGWQVVKITEAPPIPSMGKGYDIGIAYLDLRRQKR